MLSNEWFWLWLLMTGAYVVHMWQWRGIIKQYREQFVGMERVASEALRSVDVYQRTLAHERSLRLGADDD